MKVRDLLSELKKFDGETDINFRLIVHNRTFRYLEYKEIFSSNIQANPKTINMDFEE